MNFDNFNNKLNISNYYCFLINLPIDISFNIQHVYLNFFDRIKQTYFYTSLYLSLTYSKSSTINDTTKSLQQSYYFDDNSCLPENICTETETNKSNKYNKFKSCDFKIAHNDDWGWFVDFIE